MLQSYRDSSSLCNLFCVASALQRKTRGRTTIPVGCTWGQYSALSQLLGLKKGRQLDSEAPNIFTKPFQTVTRVRLAVQTWFISFSGRGFSSHFNFLPFFSPHIAWAQQERKQMWENSERRRDRPSLVASEEKELRRKRCLKVPQSLFDAPIQDFAVSSAGRQTARSDGEVSRGRPPTALVWTSKGQDSIRKLFVLKMDALMLETGCIVYLACNSSAVRETLGFPSMTSTWRLVEGR